MNLGEKIYTLRTKSNMSQGALADALDVSRQSISKWENNTSVPELEKLIKMSEIFGVSLDELILNKTSENNTAPTQSNIQKGVSTRIAVGVILLCFSFAVWLTITLLGDILSGLIWASPFFTSGIICLTVRRHTLLWCFWALYGCVELYMRYATGIGRQFVIFWIKFFISQSYINPVQFAISFLLLAWFLTLLVITAVKYKSGSPERIRALGISTALIWAGLILYNYISGKVFVSIVFTESLMLRLFSAGDSFIQSGFIVVGVIMTVKFVNALRKKKNLADVNIE